MATEFRVDLSPGQAAEMVDRAIVEGSVTGTLIGSHRVQGEGGRLCIVAVYEKHYWRAGNRLTLTVIIDDMDGATRVHSISGGGGEGLFRFDWGAAGSFEGCVAEALAPFRL